jgi:hypothetical protein
MHKKQRYVYLKGICKKRVYHVMTFSGASTGSKGKCTCKVCGHEAFIPISVSPFNDKRNFRRSDPRYKEYKELIANRVIRSNRLPY